MQWMIAARLTGQLLAAATLCAAPLCAQDVGADGLLREEVPMATAPQIEAAIVPERTLNCQLRRATNIDPARQQDEADIIYEGHYPLTLTLPSVQTPEVAGPGTSRPDRSPSRAYRVTADPNGIFAQFPATGFDRTADYWPAHVELAQTIMDKAFQYIILAAVPDRTDIKSIFISRAADAVAIDLKWVFRGSCRLAGS